MKIKYPFESVKIDDEFILVPIGVGSNQIEGVVRANEAANKIIQLLMQGDDEKDIVDLLSKEYENDRNTLATYVHSVISFLKDNQLVD